MNEEDKPADNRALLSCTQEGVVFWINDYMCSLCGCELPPSFVEERQEHSDYHLAEMLQKESMDNFGRLIQGRYTLIPAIQYYILFLVGKSSG